MIQQRNLGREAIKYIEETLAEGKTLATYLRKLDLQKGKVVTFLPSEVTNEEAKQFKWSKLPQPPLEAFSCEISKDGKKSLVSPKPDTDSYLIISIQEFLIKEGHRCIFEDAIREASDLPKLSLTTSYLAFNNELYHILSPRELQSASIMDTIKLARNFYPGLIGALTTIPKNQNFHFENNKITSKQLKILAELTEKIVIGAYDGEGYLIWSRE